MSVDFNAIIEYIRQNRQTYTREAITSRLVSAGYNPSEVEAAWEVVDPVLRDHAPAIAYKAGTWGPSEAEDLLPAGNSWQQPAS